MLFYNFKNYEEFKELFGERSFENGNKQRDNKILLRVLQDRNTLKLTHSDNTNVRRLYSYLVKSRSNEEALIHLYAFLTSKPHTDCWEICLAGKCFFSSMYELDELNGICVNGETNKVRVRCLTGNNEGKILRVKVGKFFSSILNEYCYLPLQLRRYAEEDFSRLFISYAERNRNEMRLVVDRDFRFIYDSDNFVDEGDFDSCMTDKDNYNFYTDSVDAHAASLQNEDGQILARCIIFDCVKDGYGNRYRLAERQNSVNCNDTLKQILVDKLIEEGYIDGYKRVGAGCRDHSDFILNDGTELCNKTLHIRCNLHDDDYMAYMDSFKYYNETEEIAYNKVSCDHISVLNDTDEIFRSDFRWSNFYDEYVNIDNCVLVPTHDNEYILEEDCIKIHGEWYYEKDVVTCPYCGEMFYKESDDAVYEQSHGQYFCSEYCHEKYFEDESTTD